MKGDNEVLQDNSTIDFSIFENLLKISKNQGEFHFICLHHGNNASHAEMNEYYLAFQKLIQKYPNELQDHLFCYNCHSSEKKITSLGVDVVGTRAAMEIVNFWKQKFASDPKLSQNQTMFKLSVIGQSLGGLILRQAIYLLFSDTENAKSDVKVALNSKNKEYPGLTVEDFENFQKRCKPHLFRL